MAFIMLRYISSIPNLLIIFIVKWYRILLKHFFFTYRNDHMICILHPVGVVYHIYLFAYAEPSLHPGVNPTWSGSMIFLMCYWIWFPRILMRLFTSVFTRYIGLQFSFLIVFLSVFRIRINGCPWPHKMSLKVFPFIKHLPRIPNNQQSGKVTYGIEGNTCKSCIWQGINFQSIQRTPTTQWQEKK